jgi:hypothetical protein
MFRSALKHAAKEVFTGKNPVETADKMKQAAEAIIKGATSQSEVMHRVTPQKQKSRTFLARRSSPISSPNFPITPKYEFQPQTPVKPIRSDRQEPLLPKLPRHRRRDTTTITYAPTYTNPDNIIRKLFN